MKHIVVVIAITVLGAAFIWSNRPPSMHSATVSTADAAPASTRACEEYLFNEINATCIDGVAYLVFRGFNRGGITPKLKDTKPLTIASCYCEGMNLVMGGRP